MMFDFDGRIWRAAFVAMLALIAFVLARYWSSLRAYTLRVRAVLVSLRGLSLLLIACALAGLHVARDTGVPPRVLLHRYVKSARGDDATAEHSVNASRQANSLDAKLRRIASALAERSIESLDLDATRDAATMKRHDDFSAAVLLTDGATRPEETRRAMSELSAAAGGVPVYVAADFEMDDVGRGHVALHSAIPASGILWRGVPVTIRCEVHGHGMSGRESLVTITDETQAVRASSKVRWTTNDEWQTVALQIVPKVAGWINYTARVEAASVENAATLARSFAMYAEEHRARVLFFEGEPTWEAKFIRRALGESGLFDVDYFAQVSRAAAVGIAKNRKHDAALNKEDSTQASGANEDERAPEDSQGTDVPGTDAPEIKLHETLKSAARLNVYDCIIVGATPNALLSSAEVEHLREWVERRGGGLVVLGGNSFAGSIAAPNGKLYSMLPAEIASRHLTSELQLRARGVPLEASEEQGNVALTPTELGAGGALGGYREARETALAADGKAADRALLSGAGFQLSALRAGAFTLATSGTAGADGTSDVGAPLIAAMRNGAGRTLLFAPADSWRIRTGASGAQNETGGAFNALWQGLALWAAASARAPVKLVLNNDSPATGSEIIAELNVRDAAFAALKIEKVNAHLQRIAADEENTADVAEETTEIAFTPDEDASLWRARFKAPARGRFRLEVDYTAGGKSGRALKYFTVVAPEILEAGAAHDALNRLARETGGKVFDGTDARSLADTIAALPRSNEKVQRVWELRMWWPLTLILPLLLAAEWFARRWWQID